MEDFGAGRAGGLEIAVWQDGHEGAWLGSDLEVRAALDLGPDTEDNDLGGDVEGKVFAFADLDVTGFGVFFDDDHGAAGADFVDTTLFGFVGFFGGIFGSSGIGGSVRLEGFGGGLGVGWGDFRGRGRFGVGLFHEDFEVIAFDVEIGFAADDFEDADIAGEDADGAIGVEEGVLAVDEGAIGFGFGVLEGGGFEGLGFWGAG